MSQSSGNAPRNAANWLRHPARQRTKRSGYASREAGSVLLRRLSSTTGSALMEFELIGPGRNGPFGRFPARLIFLLCCRRLRSPYLVLLGLRHQEQGEQEADGRNSDRVD